MSMIRAPWLVGGLATSAVLLVAAVTLLVWRQGPGPLVKSLELAAAPAASQDRFPSDFGRLADLVPFAGGINPVAAAVVPVAHGPEYRDPDWVKSQSPEHWTLQVLASQDGWSREVWTQLGELGLLAINIPEEEGGIGAGLGRARFAGERVARAARRA